MTTRRAAMTGLTAGALMLPCLVRAQTAPPGPANGLVFGSSSAPQAPGVSEGVVAASADLADRMTVPVLVNGMGPFPFVVDTGSNRSVVSDVLALQLNLEMGDVMRVHAATGIVNTGSVRVSTLAIGKRSLSNVELPVLTQQNLGAMGMLGIDAVASQRIVLDFRHNKLSITTPAHPHDDIGSVVVKARSKYGQLLLVDSWVEGIPIYVIIDTGGEMTIGNLKLREMLAKRRSGYPQPIQVTSVTGDSVTADLSFLPKVRMGNVGMNNLQIAYADMYAFKQFGLEDKPAMLLGMSTLRHFDRVSIDFPAREVRFLFGEEGRIS